MQTKQKQFIFYIAQQARLSSQELDFSKKIMFDFNCPEMQIQKYYKEFI